MKTFNTLLKHAAQNKKVQDAVKAIPGVALLATQAAIIARIGFGDAFDAWFTRKKDSKKTVFSLQDAERMNRYAEVKSLPKKTFTGPGLFVDHSNAKVKVTVIPVKTKPCSPRRS